MKLSINPILYQFRRPRKILKTRGYASVSQNDDNDYKYISDFELLCIFMEMNPELRQHLDGISNDTYNEFSSVLIDNPNLINGMDSDVFKSIIATISAKLEDEQDKILYQEELEHNKCLSIPDIQEINDTRESRHAGFLRIIEFHKEKIAHVIIRISCENF